ncbi:MAG: hypothetical protein QM571_07560 [Micrococcaceae bacterium]
MRIKRLDTNTVEFTVASSLFMNANDRVNHWKGRSFKTAKLRAAAADFAKEHLVDLRYSETSPCTVQITVVRSSNHKFDAPNCYPTAKALIDGLTDAGVFTDE